MVRSVESLQQTFDLTESFALLRRTSSQELQNILWDPKLTEVIQPVNVVFNSLSILTYAVPSEVRQKALTGPFGFLRPAFRFPMDTVVLGLVRTDKR